MIALTLPLAFALIYFLKPEYLAQTEHETTQYYNNEIKELAHTGSLRSANRGVNVIHSEETKMIRPLKGITDPRQSNINWSSYYQKKNAFLGWLYGWGAAVLDNKKILRPSYTTKPRLVGVPSREGFEGFEAIPNTYFDRDSAAEPIENKVYLYRDPYGQAGGAPEQGASYVVLNELYDSNPWGTGGQGFIAVGNQYRNPDYAAIPPPKSNLQSIKNQGKSVSFKF